MASWTLGRQSPSINYIFHQLLVPTLFLLFKIFRQIHVRVSRDEKLDPGHLLSQLPVEESRRAEPAVRGQGSGGPAETLLFVSSPSLLLTSFFSSVLREGVPRGTRGGDTPPAFALWQMRTMGPSTVRMCH